MLKPKRIKPGSTIAIISPSNGLPHLFPGIYELGLKNLRDSLDLNIIEMPTSRMSQDDLFRNPQLRAKDINDSFKNDQIDGIITSIGGYESVRILPYLEIDAILKNPKLIMGFSDATTFLSYLNLLGMVTFYGPSVMAGFAQMENLPRQFREHLKTFLLETQYPYTYKPYSEWTNGYKDWSNNETLGECTEFYQNEKGWTFLQGNSISEGYLWGGCIEVLEFLKGTAYWPDKEFWNNKILFFETSEDKPLPDQVGHMLRNYGMQGVFNRIKGIIFGRPKDYSPSEKEELNYEILRIIQDEFKATDLTIVTDFDFGHTDPKLILPLGGKVRLNPTNQEIILLEDPFFS